MVRAHGRLTACPQRTEFSHWPRRKPDRVQPGEDTSKYPLTAQRLSRPAARIFYGEVRSNEETDQTMPVVQVSEMGVIRLPESAFRAFKKLGISQAFNLQKKFFSNRALYFTFF